METIDLGATGRKTTRLGYGCSGLTGATGRAESLAMLEAAFDAGVRHFDVAPTYGSGEAESCVGEFLGRHRAEVTVTAKYGGAPAKTPGLIGFARSIAGPVAKVLPGLKKRLAKGTGKVVGNGRKVTVAHAKESLERSLKELRTDRIDVWLLHAVKADDLREDDGLLRLLENSVAAGTIGSFGVGSEREKIRTLAIKRPQFCGTMQFEWSVMDAPVPTMQGFRIHPRALGDNFRGLHAGLLEEKGRCSEWSEKTGADLADGEALASLMLKASLVENPESVILFSSTNPAHIQRNVETAGDATLEAGAKKLYGLVQAAAKGRRAIEAGG